ncbi:MAG: long-chain fatty acid--CoA ligase [Actinobacteria bacterium]|nr:MAG: long-chain fatty acid--CoA ligase [Actinomycetota bacterium]
MESGTAAKRAIDAGTFAEAFRITAANRENEIFVRTKGDDVALTWREVRERVDALAGGLAKLGLARGQSMAILLTNRPEFHIADLAAVTLGATPFSIYMTYSPEQIQYVVSDAEARILVTEPSFLPQVLEARKSLPDLEHVMLVDGEHPDCLRLDEVEGSNPDFDVEAAAAAVQPDDVLTLIYTSGTTGPPKGVQIAHRNMMAGVRSTEDIIHFPDGSRVISWLPAAHIAERAAHHYLPIGYGFQVTCCPNPRDVMAYLPDVRPQWFFAVPRIWEKLKAGLETMLAGLPDEQRAGAQAAVDAAIEKVRLEQRGEPVPDELAEKVRQADEQLFSGLRAHLGFDQIAAVNVGAAPTPLEVLEYFHAIGIPVSELWGMSETCGSGACNPPDRIKLGTVGPPAPGVEIKLADDGEVLVRSEVVMVGYRNMPDRTAEALDADGWLHTGDIGEFDEDGYLKIVDRKKEIIINKAGKNMSPAYIESHLKSSSSLIGQAAVIGDGRSYNTALIVLDPDFAPAWAAQNGLEGTSLEELARDDKLRAAIQEGVDAANAKLARVEQIKKFHIVPGDWQPGGDELTPTMKLKRKPIDRKYAEEIETMYA